VKRKRKDVVLKTHLAWCMNESFPSRDTCMIPTEQKQKEEIIILSVDFGIVLTICLLTLNKVNGNINCLWHWESIRICDHDATSTVAMKALTKWASTFFASFKIKKEMVILLENQPPTKAIRTRSMFCTLYGYLFSLFPNATFVFMDPRKKLEYCFQIGAESKKEEAENHTLNKDLAIQGCLLVLKKQTEKDEKWKKCLKWFENQLKQDDFADSLLQALAWYHYLSQNKKRKQETMLKIDQIKKLKKEHKAKIKPPKLELTFSNF